MEIENIKSVENARNALFFEPLMLKNLKNIFDKKFKQSKDLKMLDIIQKLKRVKHYRMILKEDTVKYNEPDQKEIKCNVCQKKYKGHLDLVLHWLYAHREINFKITFHRMINEYFILDLNSLNIWKCSIGRC